MNNDKQFHLYHHQEQVQGPELEPKITPSSHSSTLRRSHDSKTQTMTKTFQHQQQSKIIPPPIYDSKPTQSLTGTTSSSLLVNNQTKTILSSATNPFSTYERNTLDYRHLNSLHETNNQHNYHTLANHKVQQNHLLDYRQQVNGSKFTNEFGLSTSGSDLRIANNLNLSNSSIANQLLPNASGGAGLARLQSATLASSGTTSLSNKESNRNHHGNNRNHIITDTLPGPESCV